MHLLFPILGFILERATADTTCRCYPGDSCWPTPQQWSEFNQTLGGRLIPIVPLGSVCHTVGQYALYDIQACTNLTANWGFPHTHYQTPSSPMASWFANFSCDPFLPPEVPCELGGLQQFAVNVSGVEDVLKTLYFVKEHNIRVIIRNTGHDYLGKSTAPGAVALWMHHLKDTQYLDYTSPYYNGSALRLGAGVQGFEAMRAAHAHNKVILTGNCESVGVAGGYTQGGGHGQLASQFGLAADQVLEWEIVTAAGDLLTASPTENADLFWALSGGGGGTFAVVLSVTVRVHSEMITTSANLTFSRLDVPNNLFWEAVETFVSSAALLADAGAVAIWMVSNSTFSVTPITWPGAPRSQLQEHLNPTLTLLEGFNITYCTIQNMISTCESSL
ncbi:FAD binding domain protein [Penicillium malachiteum]|uniref:FAD binding domain protein n=1 Tax=Penicillium malachiteum TaxID=1324776 RepID=A0AAD6HGH3_9EURO|nr:FAD binding domain protein [Penicillium malachiteum]